MPVASETAFSPYFSRSRSAAESAWFHFLVRALALQADLLALVFEVRSVHAQQANRVALPVGAKEFANRGQHLRIDRSRLAQACERA